MFQLFRIGLLFILFGLFSCSNNSDFSVEKTKRQTVTDQIAGIHLFVDSINSNAWLNQLTKNYPLDSNLFYRNRYLTAHSFILHSRSNIEISTLSNIRIGFIQNFTPTHYDTSFSKRIGSFELTAYKNPTANGQWLVDLGDLDINSANQNDFKELKKLVVGLSDNLGLEGYFEKNNPTEYIRGIQSEIESIWGLSLQIPNDWKIFGTDTGFLWLGKFNPIGGFYSLWISKTLGSQPNVGLMEHYLLRNTATKRNFHNDEGTKMVISEIPSFKTKEIDKNFFQGWYTEEATTRRGPYLTKYIFNPKTNQTLLVDVFCPESEYMSNDLEFLKQLIKNVNYTP